MRRSVANHLNDIAKDHPALIADGLAQHLPGATAERRALLRHARQPQRLAVDYAVHPVKAGGHSTAKVFKDCLIELAPGATRLLEKQHPGKPITSRRYHAGNHAVDVRINGAVQAQAEFELTLGSAQPTRETRVP